MLKPANYMKFPVKIRTHCPFCRAHKDHKVLVVKKRERGELKAGQRRFREILRGYRGYPRPKAQVIKQTKRVDVRLECSECKKKHTKTRTFRAKKFEIQR